jgi:hypothetical protein
MGSSYPNASLTMFIILKPLHWASQKVLLYPLVKKLPTVAPRLGVPPRP